MADLTVARGTAQRIKQLEAVLRARPPIPVGFAKMPGHEKKFFALNYMDWWRQARDALAETEAKDG